MQPTGTFTGGSGFERIFAAERLWTKILAGERGQGLAFDTTA